MSHQVSTRTIAVGTRVTTGWGTLNIVTREVATVEGWHYNGYYNVNLTFTDGTSDTMWDGTYWSRAA